MAKIFLRLLLLTGLAFINSRCSTTDSEDVATESFYAVYTLIEDGPNTRGQVTYYVGGITGTVLQLSEGDSVTCNGTILTEGQNLLNQYYYWGSCGVQEVDGTYTFVFTRETEEGTQTYSSTVTLPPPVTLSNPSNNDSFTRGDAIPVQWNAGDDEIRITLSGQGTSSDPEGGTTSFLESYTSTDSGSYTIPGADTNPDSITGGISSGEIRITRSREGTMTGMAGSITASTEDAVTGLTFSP